jgi:DNA-binding protein Fis
VSKNSQCTVSTKAFVKASADTEEPSADPTETPAATREPSSEPVETSIPTVEPIETPIPTVEPIETPIPTVEPEPTETPIPTLEPEPTETPAVPIERPGKVSNIKICYGKNNSRLVITWNEAKNAEKYLIYRQMNNKAFRYVGTTKNCRFDDKRIKANKKYRYKIVSYQSEAINKENSKLSRWFSTKTIVNTKHQRYSYSEMSRDIHQLKAAYGDRVHYQVIGKSVDGRNLYDVIIGNPNAKKTLLVVSNLHAREYMTAQLCMAQIEYYLKNYYRSISGTVPVNVFEKIAVHYVPMANPDGVTISQYGIRAIHKASLRKTLRKMPGANRHRLWKANARGVDLNRNYPVSYRARYQKRGSEGYTGTHAASEPETKAILSLLRKIRKTSKLKGVVNYHAMGSIAFGGCSKRGNVRKVTTAMYRRAVALTRYGSSAGYNTGKPSIGNFREYVVHKKKIPSITLEIGVRGCPLPSSQFPSVWRRNYRLVLEEAKLLRSK